MEQNCGIKANYDYQENTVFFSTEENINTGINLEELLTKDYYIFLRISYSNSDVKYYALCNKSKYQETKYYTITKNSKNNRIIICFSNYDNNPYMVLKVKELEKLPENVYDVAVDIGITKTKQSEDELIINCGKTLKNMLENEGMKVLLTRDSNEKKDTESNMYDDNGRINIINASGAKFLISLDLNNNLYSKNSGGVEVYAASNLNLAFATSLAGNIVQKANAKYSKLNLFKKEERSICTSLYKCRYKSPTK